MFSNSRVVILFFLSIIGLVQCGLIRVQREDMVRCKISEKICEWTCRLGGHSDGYCQEIDDELECICSETDLDEYICGGEVGPKLAGYTCAGFCQAKGYQSGDCNYANVECQCTKETMKASNIKCINDEVCSIYCQFRKGKATGRCTGPNKWDCECISNKFPEDIAEK